MAIETNLAVAATDRVATPEITPEAFLSADVWTRRHTTLAPGETARRADATSGIRAARAVRGSTSAGEANKKATSEKKKKKITMFGPQ